MSAKNQLKFIIPNEIKDDDIRNIVRGSLANGNLPGILCIHHMMNKNDPKHRLFLNICGVNGVFAGCSDTCIATTMTPFIAKETIGCLECHDVIGLDSKIKIRHDAHNNSYLYCSSECFNKSPQSMTRCSHIETFEFISGQINRTQLYYGNDPNIQCVRRTCKNCPIVYPTDGKLHCYECKKPMEPKGKSVVGIIEEGRHFVHKNGTIYLTCSDICKEKMERLNNNICQMCGLYGSKRCTKCGVYYCSRKCQIEDWPIHKSVCVSSISNASTDS